MKVFYFDLFYLIELKYFTSFIIIMKKVKKKTTILQKNVKT